MLYYKVTYKIVYDKFLLKVYEGHFCLFSILSTKLLHFRFSTVNYTIKRRDVVDCVSQLPDFPGVFEKQM